MADTGEQVWVAFDELVAHLRSSGSNSDESIRLLQAFVRRVIHDVSSPVAAFSLELFSLEYLASAASKAGAADQKEELASALEKIADVQKNLMEAEATARRLIAGLDTRSSELGTPSGGGPASS